jgi:hypothetical protein
MSLWRVGSSPTWGTKLIDNKSQILYNKIMYKVISKSGLPLNSCVSLDEALSFARIVGMFVTIRGPDFEVCGVFGVDTVRDGKCPDGVAYDWNKASRIGATRR